MKHTKIHNFLPTFICNHKLWFPYNYATNRSTSSWFVHMACSLTFQESSRLAQCIPFGLVLPFYLSDCK
jgi:hypothetical protein